MERSPRFVRRPFVHALVVCALALPAAHFAPASGHAAPQTPPPQIGTPPGFVRPEPVERRRRFADGRPTLLRRVMNDTSIRQATYYFKFYLFEALKKTKSGDEFLPQLAPWRAMIANGLSTFAESPEPVRSDCHAWSASPLYAFLSTVCGINPASPGFTAVRIEPYLGELQFVEGEMPHPAGKITVRVQKTPAGGLFADVELPPGIKGMFRWQDKSVPLRPGLQHIDL